MKNLRFLFCIFILSLSTVKINAQCGPLSTPNLTNNGQDGIMFDIVALNPVVITSLDMDFDAGTKTIQIYSKAGTHVGFQANAAAWTYEGQVTVATAGLGVHTVLNIPLNVSICPGNRAAFYVTSANGGCNYSNGVAVGNVLAADANMQILTGTGKDHLYGASFQPRSPNVTAHYTCPGPSGPPANAGPDQTICSTTAVMAASAGGTWSVVSGTGTFSNVNDPNATVTGLSVGLNQFQWTTACPTTTDIVNITVVPPPTANVPANATYCAGDNVPASNYTSTPPGATYTWTNSNTAIGLAASGTGNTPAFNATNTGTTPITGTITVTPTLNGCVGNPVTYTITVNPTPTANVPANATYCAGDNVPASAFTSNVAGATYSWTNSNTAIGLAASGTGNTPAFNATNAGATPITGTITVTPTANGCVGNPVTYTITVNPVPTANVPANATYCAGDNVPASAFTSNPAGATYTWTNSNTAIGLAASGTGNTPAFNATNAGATPISGTITVTPTLNGCVGNPVTYTITVNPVPTANVPANATYCPGDPVPASAFTSNPAGATFNWTNSNTAIGLAASGTGNTPAFNATNTGTTPITGTITVTPTLNGCAGNPVTYTITVNPTPAAPTAANVTICPNNTATLTATAPGGNYEWFDAPVAGNLLASNASYTTPVLTANTTYYVQTTVNGCVSPRTAVTVTIAPSISVFASADTTICDGYTHTLSVTPNGPGYTFVWDELPGNPNFSNIFNPTVTPNATTTYVITVTDANNCTGDDSVTITVNPVPTMNAPANITVCNGDPIAASAFTSNPAGATFNWTNSNTAIGLAASGTGNTPAFNATNTGTTPITGTITVTPTLNGCAGNPVTYTITVNPTPAVPTAANVTICPNNTATLTATAPGGNYEWFDAPVAGNLLASNASYTTPVLTANTTYYVQTTVNGCVSPRTAVTVTIAPSISVFASADTTICDGYTHTLSVTPNGPGYTFVWDELPGNPNFSNIFNPTVTPNATTTYVITVTDANNCTGDDSVTVTVNPVPTMNAPANITVCNGDPIAASAFTSNPAGATFNWTNSNTAIGLAASGTGNTPAFNATNTGTTPITGTITVTPTLNGCAGNPVTYTITVNPTPTVVVPANDTVCDGSAVAAANFVSTPAGGTFAWTNSDPTIGLAASGTGNIPTFNAVNTGTTPVTAVITVTPTANGCTGTPSSYSITVNPTPTMTTPANITVCNNDPIAASAFASLPTGGTFAWTNSDPSIGLAASGTGNTPAFTAINATNAPVTATITVTPTVNGCVGNPITYTITVNPGAIVTSVNNILVCPGDLVAASNFASLPAGGTFAWTNSNTSIGLGASGTGNTPAFTAINNGSTPLTATISVTATANGCPGPASTYTITVAPVTTGSTNVAICQGDSILIGGNYYSAAGNYNDTITNSYGCDSILTYNLTVNIVSVSTSNVLICDGDSVLLNGNYYNSAGTYPFTFTSAAGCDSIVIYVVTVDPLPLINIIIDDNTLHLGESTNITAYTGLPNTSYSWSPPDGLSCVFCASPIATPQQSGWYYVTATNANGCSSVDSVYIDVDPTSNIYVPNIFSPNEDGQNDIYKVRGKGIDLFYLAIYNRWGQMVFESNDIDRGWDGTKDGKLLNQGVFVFKLNITMKDGETYQQTGNITLVR